MLSKVSVPESAHPRIPLPIINRFGPMGAQSHGPWRGARCGGLDEGPSDTIALWWVDEGDGLDMADFHILPIVPTRGPLTLPAWLASVAPRRKTADN